MKTGRAILSGALIWLLVLILFGVMDAVPATHHSQLLQAIIVCVSIIPFSLLGARIYYKTGDRSRGLSVGLVMVGTALLLDALITVPLVEQPYHNIDHYQFFTNPLLWTIVIEDLLVIWLYYKMKIGRA
jgi:hypothetical protein